MTVTINNVQLVSDSLALMEAEVNGLTNSTLPGVSAELNATGTALVLTSAVGDDVRVNIESIDGGDSLTIQGDTGITVTDPADTARWRRKF